MGNPKFDNSKVYFNGHGNILYCEKGAYLKDCFISFRGNNSIIFLSKNKSTYKLRVEIFTDCSLYFGKDNYMTNKVKFIIQEYSNIFIGNNNTFSTNIKFRTSDAHPIYEIPNKKRINPSGNIILGDHIWICADVNIYKNTEIGSGSIIGSDSLVSNKKIISNSLYVGSPAKELRTNVCYDSRYVGNDSVDDSEDNHEIDDFIFEHVKEELILLDQFKDNMFSKLDMSEKIAFFKNISQNNFKNRFFRNNDIFNGR